MSAAQGAVAPQSVATTRLAALPRRVAMPLRELLAVGQLSEETLGTVLDGVQLAGSPAKALGFAVGFLYLQSQGVPVKDVIRMACAQRRRIRLDWSAQRWKEEHVRLSRAETLQRLGGENVQYDLAAVAAALPPHFRGYLIRSSRRLGMVGLRQRHCVASYDAQIRAGYCAIASVFIDRERWTVQLSRTGDPQAPLRIVQVRSRFNKMPSAEVRTAIQQELGIRPPTRAAAQAAGVAEEHVSYNYMENLRRILPMLRASGVKQVTVDFDGCGDSGSIGDIDYGGAPMEGAACEVEIEVMSRHFDSGQWITQRGLETKTLDSAIETLTEDYLAETGVDWYNGDGGFGVLHVDVEKGTVSLEVSQRFTESTTEFSRTNDIATGEELDD